MNCPKCQLLEMRVDKVVDNEIHYICKNCGEKVIKSIEELEKEKGDEK